MLWRSRLPVRLVPVLTPVVGIGGPYPFRQLAQPVADQGGKVAGVGRGAAVQGPGYLIHRGVSVLGVAAQHPLPFACLGQVEPPRLQRMCDSHSR